MKQPSYLANFDSMTAMIRGVSNYLNGNDLPMMGMRSSAMTHALQPPAALLNALPRAVREQIYIWSGWGEAIAPRKLDTVSAEDVAQWMVNLYPKRQYPAIVIGSASGALVHLCCALGIPWLPQTFFIPVARSLDPDEPLQDMEFGKQHAHKLLEANPELQLHHMNDANQDRLMIRRMTYFRVKRLILGRAFEKFIEEHVAPGGTIIISECTLTWPTVKIADRHIFQHGALGGASPEEFHYGSARIGAYLERYGSPYRRWPSPEPDGDRPEAEWGFEPALRSDIERVARNNGYKLRRLIFSDPEHLSPFVADLYRWWYRQHNMPANRLLAESFAMHEPYWAVRTGSVPYWMTFNKEPSAENLERYLDMSEPYDEIFMMLFMHGVDSVGLVPFERWRRILKRARKRGEFLGVDEAKYPRDFAAFVRYYTDLKRKIQARYPRRGPMALRQLDQFIKQAGDRYRVQWLEHTAEREQEVGAGQEGERVRG